MTPLLRKSSPLDRRIRKIDKELSSIDERIRLRAKRASKLLPQGMQEAADAESTALPENDTDGTDSELRQEQEVGTVKTIGKRIHDDRFADYLASSFQPVRPLRHERRIQRNKAIVMLIVLALLLFAVLYQFLI